MHSMPRTVSEQTTEKALKWLKLLKNHLPGVLWEWEPEIDERLVFVAAHAGARFSVEEHLDATREGGDQWIWEAHVRWIDEDASIRGQRCRDVSPLMAIDAAFKSFRGVISYVMEETPCYDA